MAPARLLPLAFLLALLPAACVLLASSDEVQSPSSSPAFVEARVLATPLSRTPVAGVIMIVESDRGSEQPFAGPDQSFMSNGNGVVRAEVLNGVQLGPQAEQVERLFDLSVSGSLGETCVYFIHEGHGSSLRCGIPLRPGAVHDLGTFYLSDFTLLPGDGAE